MCLSRCIFFTLVYTLVYNIIIMRTTCSFIGEFVPCVKTFGLSGQQWWHNLWITHFVINNYMQIDKFIGLNFVSLSTTWNLYIYMCLVLFIILSCVMPKEMFEGKFRNLVKNKVAAGIELHFRNFNKSLEIDNWKLLGKEKCSSGIAKMHLGSKW